MIGQKGGAETTTLTVAAMTSHTHTCTPSGANGCITGSTGSSVPVPIRQPYLVMNYVIALTGIFPTHNRRRNLRASADSLGTSNHTRSGEAVTTQTTEPYLGEIMLTSFNLAPSGWAPCDGRLLALNQNIALFSLLGTQYGGDGRVTFALPDLRGRSLVGFGQGPGLSHNYNIGERGGAETVTLVSSDLPIHDHLV